MLATTKKESRHGGRLRRTRLDRGYWPVPSTWWLTITFTTCWGSENGGATRTPEDGSAKGWAAGRMPVLASALLSGMNITGWWHLKSAAAFLFTKGTPVAKMWDAGYFDCARRRACSYNIFEN